jgi:hypothetical protein
MNLAFDFRPARGLPSRSSRVAVGSIGERIPLRRSGIDSAANLERGLDALGRKRNLAEGPVASKAASLRCARLRPAAYAHSPRLYHGERTL